MAQQFHMPDKSSTFDTAISITARAVDDLFRGARESVFNALVAAKKEIRRHIQPNGELTLPLASLTSQSQAQAVPSEQHSNTTR
jgi:hypothetical protein